MEEENRLKETLVAGNGRSVTYIPFEQAGGLILVTAEVNGSPGSFILDTGAPRLIINSKYIEKKEDHFLRAEAQGVGGAITSLDFHPVESFDWQGIRIEAQGVILMDLERIEARMERPIHGLIGYDLLKDYDVLLDYDRREVTLIVPEAFEAFRQEHLAGTTAETLSFELQVHLPMVEARIGGETLRMAIDSGAETNLVDEWLYHRLQSEITETDETELAGADNQEKVVTLTNIRSMRIGNREYRDLTTVFSGIGHLEKQLQTRIDGIIGSEILSEQPTLIRYGAQEIWFIENSKE